MLDGAKLLEHVYDFLPIAKIGVFFVRAISGYLSRLQFFPRLFWEHVA
jgi:hypothetical protein